ncbi:endonuclease domain-containing protein [Herbiconiux flava]|uniref:Very-short-patch-repair endonuclease n=1 Tax=Herbiconiux flava TaxID=881268 RepID=A0A852SIQ0_9MICO|nr:DUF559 domain-containing protein [Herbiconiux flava]NYD69694.1 very-short-patch-repair endonuclease [Herbiconiux flava]GLK16441.1 hypothetical protein GCM10017602_09230 [Herbiconiux flava]
MSPMSQDASLGPEFSVARARASGVSVGRLRNPGLARPFHGVRARVVPTGLEALCRAYAQIMPSDAAFSHVTAALLHGLPVPAALLPATTLHVTRPRRALEAAGVSGHQQRLGPSEVVHANGLRVTSPPPTLCDLGGSGQFELRDLVAVADAILGAGIRSPFDDDWESAPPADAMQGMSIRSPFDDDWESASRVADASLGMRIHSPSDGRVSAAPMAGPSELDDALAAWPGRRGRPLLRRALELADGPAESPQESRLRVLLVEAGFATPQLQHEVRDARGRFVARVDLAYPERRLAIEYEGDHHRVQAQQWRRDIGRTRELEHLGWRVLRVTASDLSAPRPLLLQLASVAPRARRR